jgi:hypothetical protein
LISSWVLVSTLFVSCTTRLSLGCASLCWRDDRWWTRLVLKQRWLPQSVLKKTWTDAGQFNKWLRLGIDMCCRWQAISNLYIHGSGSWSVSVSRSSWLTCFVFDRSDWTLSTWLMFEHLYSTICLGHELISQRLFVAGHSWMLANATWKQHIYQASALMLFCQKVCCEQCVHGF